MKFRRHKMGNLDFINKRTKMDKIKKNSQPTYLFNNKYYSLDEYATKYYESRGYKVIHTGNYTWTRMLTILFKDIFKKFNKISNEKGYRTEFYDKEHFNRCKKEIIKRTNALKTTDLKKEIDNSDEPRYNKEKMSKLINEFDNEQILKVLYDLINDFSHKKSGFPELFVYNDEDSFFSVLKPNYDQLTAKEVRKQEIFLKTGIDIQILGINRSKNWKKEEQEKYFNKSFYDNTSFKERYEHSIKNTEKIYKRYERNNLTDVENYFINNYDKFTFLGFLNKNPNPTQNQMTILTNEVINEAVLEGNNIRRSYFLSRGYYYEERGLLKEAIKQYRKAADYYGYSKACDCYHKRRQHSREIDLIYNVINDKSKISPKYVVNFKRRANRLDSDKKLVSSYKTKEICPTCGSEMILTVLHDKNNTKYFKCLNGSCYQYGGTYKGNLNHFEKISDVIEYKKEKIELPNLDFNPDKLSDKEKQSKISQLNKQGSEYIHKGEYDEAIIFYEQLIDNPLFKSKTKPYRILTEIYDEKNEPHNAVKVLVKFFKAGIKCKSEQFNWFKGKLLQLSKQGHIKHSRVKQLQNEYNQKTGIVKPPQQKNKEVNKKVESEVAEESVPSETTKVENPIEIKEEDLDLDDDAELIITKLDNDSEEDEENPFTITKIEEPTEESGKTTEKVEETTTESEETAEKVEETTTESEETAEKVEKTTDDEITELLSSSSSKIDKTILQTHQEETEDIIDDEETSNSELNISEEQNDANPLPTTRINKITIKTSKKEEKPTKEEPPAEPEKKEEVQKEEPPAEPEKKEEPIKKPVKEEKPAEPSPYDGIEESELMKTAAKHEDRLEYKRAIEIYEYLINKASNYDAALRLRICYRRLKLYDKELKLIFDSINNEEFDEQQQDYFKKRLGRFEFQPTSQSSSSFYANNVEVLETNDKCPVCNNDVVVKIIERRGNVKYYTCSNDDCYWFGGEYKD